MAETAEDVEDLKTEQRETAHNITNVQASSESKPVKSEGSKRNAFSELMAPKPKQLKVEENPTAKPANMNSSDPRSGLLSYIRHPESFSDKIVIRVTPDTVLIRDMYPKATVHLLLLPRSESRLLQNPRDAFDDISFLSLIRSEAESAAELAASELSRLISPFSATCKPRNDALEASDPPAELPPGRDFMKDIRIGVHAHPSMSHLHVHIISCDMHSDRLKHRKHYNSFNTDFFIPLNDFPLAKDDTRRVTATQNANLKKDFVCWRCEEGFGNKFADLKRHLDEEFEEWKRE